MINELSAKFAEPDILTVLCALGVFGLIRLIYDLCRLMQRKIFGEQYLSKYDQLLNGGQFNGEIHQWLLQNLAKMEDQMGKYGRIDRYRPAYLNSEILNHAFLSFTLNNIESPIADFQGTHDLLKQYIGALDNQIRETWTGVLNPLKWLARAVRFVLIDGPLWILKSVGIIGDNTSNVVSRHSITTKIVGTIAIFGTLVSIISGWNELVKFLSPVLRWLHFIGVN